MAQRSVDLGSFAPGLNNRVEPTRLDTRLPDRSKATYLYAADNADLTANGYLKRRRGFTQRIASPTHSVWSDRDAAEMFAVVAGQLERIVEGGTGLVRSVVRAGMPQLPVSYSRGADGAVYWSNGAAIRRVENGVDRPVATEPLGLIPAISVGAGAGALRPGQYLVAFTRSGADGESPATPVVAVDVPENGAINVTFTEPVNVYVSAPDGDILTLQTSGATAAISTHNETGRRCATLNRALMPPGTIVRHYRGQLLVAAGSVLFVSDPYNYGLYNPSRSYVPFPAPITLVEPMDNGLYLAADKTYWIGDVFSDTLQEVRPYGAIPGTSGRSPNDQSVFWQTNRGLIVAGDNQDVKNVQEEVLEFAAASAGASLFRERDGMTHIVTSRVGVQASSAAAGAWMEAEIVRKGTT